MLALIDADSLIYKVAFAIEDKFIWNECEVDAGLEEEYVVTYDTNIPLAKETLDNYIENILFATGCDGYELHLTGNSNFRYDNPLGYKEHRKDARKPLGFKELFDYLVTEYKAKVHEYMEADDVVVYLKTKYPEDFILCAIDKDVLYQTEGDHYNYSTDDVVSVTKVEATRFAYWQTLVGDTSDGYKGCPQIGKVKATKLLKDIDDEYEMWLVTKEQFEKKGFDEDYVINMMRLANMHQYNGKKIVLYTPPKAP